MSALGVRRERVALFQWVQAPALRQHQEGDVGLCAEGAARENHGPGSERLIGVNEKLDFRIFMRMDQARGKRLPTRTKKSPVSAARRTLRSRTCTSEMSRLSVSYRS